MSLPSAFIMGANKFVIVWGVCTRIFQVLFLRGWVDAKSFTFCTIKVVFNIFPYHLPTLNKLVKNHPLRVCK
ncbi:hypothetical protein PRUPE_8G212500 [Prunus persica]|uniref:Uncharacterized protein n=1 Tax=Prunus persica TaxID=3760 RepID=A0A251N163_PRUPE|nr:hypothetical protein PRUPE_8G212500 [Prunus persica]